MRAQVLEVDPRTPRIRMGMKQLQPTSLDEYIAEHKEGDVVTGRIANVSGGRAKVELGEGVQASCAIAGGEGDQSGEPAAPAQVDLGSLSSMLSAKWKGGVASGPQPGKREAARAREIPQLPDSEVGCGSQAG